MDFVSSISAAGIVRSKSLADGIDVSRGRWKYKQEQTYFYHFLLRIGGGGGGLFF